MKVYVHHSHSHSTGSASEPPLRGWRPAGPSAASGAAKVSILICAWVVAALLTLAAPICGRGAPPAQDGSMLDGPVAPLHQPTPTWPSPEESRPTPTGQPGVLAPDVFPADVDCEIDLINNRFGCRRPEVIAMVDGPVGGRAVVRVDLDPQRSEARRVAFEVAYDGLDGWTLNLGDSRSDNGYSGDGGDQTHDSELQILGTDLTIYGSDTMPNDPKTGKVLASHPGFAGPGRVLHFTVSDGQVEYRADGQVAQVVRSPHLFALAGQPDSEGPVNHEVFAGFNRVIADSSRNGSGVTRVRIRLLP